MNDEKEKAIDMMMDQIEKQLNQPRISDKMPKGRVLHIFSNTHMFNDIRPQFADLLNLEKNDVIHHDCMFEAGFVPKDLSESEVNRYLDKISYGDTYEDNKHFFDVLAHCQVSDYDEIIYWCESTTSAIMQSFFLCSLFIDYPISVVKTVRSFLGGYINVVEYFDNRIRLNREGRMHLATKYDREEWNKDKLFVLNEGNIIEYPQECMREYIMSQLLDYTEYTACARLVGNCIGFAEPEKKFGIGIYFDEIIKMVKDGILIAKQNDSERIQKIMAEDGGYQYAPNGVDISNMAFFYVNKA